MTLQITMLIFSGRADPTWVLEGAQEDELRRLLDSPAFEPARAIIPWRMGYRGFRIIDPALPDQQREFFGAPIVEQFLLNTAPDDSPTFELPMPRSARFSMPPPDIDKPRAAIEPLVTVQLSKAVDALPWIANDPKWLGGVGNCNSYGTNRVDRTMPGEEEKGGIGPLYRNEGTFGFTGAGILSGVLWDGLVRTTGPSQQLIAGEGFHCCVVCKPGFDQHWYRQDADGWWSHKMGSSDPTRLDTRGQMIADPRFCDRGPYTIFVAWLRSPRAIWRPPG